MEENKTNKAVKKVQKSSPSLQKKKTAKKPTKKISKPVAEKTTVKKSTKTISKPVAEKNTTKVVKKVEPRVEEKVVVEIQNEEKDNTRLHLSPNRKTENKRLAILLGFVGIMVLVGVISAIVTNAKVSKTMQSVRDAVSGESTKAIYIEKTGCSYCELNQTNIDGMKDNYGVQFIDINLSDLNDKNMNELKALLKLKELSTPTLVIVGNNEVKETSIGLTSYSGLFKILQKHSLVNENQKLILNYVDYNNYKNLIKSKEPQIIVLAASTCHYCLSEHPILEKIATEKKLKINYMYLDENFGTEADKTKYAEFQKSMTWFSENSNWGTPTTLIVKEGKVLNALSGYHSYEDVVKFFTDNGLIK